MAVDSSSLAGSGFGNIDVGSEAMVFFATRGEAAAKSLKETMDSARKDSRTQKEIEAESKKLDDQLKTLLAGISDENKPENLGQITKLLKDIADNTKLSDQQRKNAKDLLNTLNASKAGDLLHTSLPAADWKKLQDIATKYQQGAGPLGDNSRGSTISWLSLYRGSKNGQAFIGSPTSKPKATAEDVKFVNDIYAYLNERQKVTVTPDWSATNPQLKALLGAHYESLKPTADIEDESVRNIMVQVALQDFNNAINGGSASSKAIHDVKKSVTDRI